MLTPLAIEDVNVLDKMRATKPFVYVATPYSKYPGGLEEAFIEASKAAAWLLNRGIPIFCPIAHSHPIATFGGIDPKNHDIWIPADTPVMEAAGGLVVVMMESWKESWGIEQEIRHFMQASKPVWFLCWPREGE